MPPSSSRKVVVTQRFFDEKSAEYLRAHGCEVVLAPPPPGQGDGDLDPAELQRMLADAAGWIVGHARVTRPLLEALPGLLVIARRGVGYERVDVEAARDLGRVVTIAAGGNDASVADHTIGLMIAVGRRFRASQADMQAGDWSILMGTDLCEKTVGLIGLGRIGRSVVRRLSGFDAKVLVHTPHPDAAYAEQTGVEYTGLTELLRRSDYVSLHAPLTQATRFLIDTRAIASMKKGAFLINTARGGLVDDAALLTGLQNGHLGGAGLDVFVSESDPAFRPVSDALLALPNVVATPHAGASSHEGLARTNMVAAKSVVTVLDGGMPAPGCVVADGR
ncbi:D-isomer specific 2-hydroxyacid dehydrogenase NAD-binding [Parvibaculum lavamentivorans DS-1]|uniref:D-isomer specific 2-hydroxyacid dehydrogenase NAD-binding n=1 Tax=Parvibaculum lavamentivorans (strain DS-1 / DSM 13023 / NCIMB 13966) TaxID=402881 RepID=A7HQH7_PARL1|nr:phosphoglycerate dehydrogenase [Parvibaculum lavamentivorans]ABS62160.1 D-isomer specific 2-hydroxyacid dehydrogenase NAD-binding [Parvibaculum lavamentivorans DS-1]